MPTVMDALRMSARAVMVMLILAAALAAVLAATVRTPGASPGSPQAIFTHARGHGQALADSSPDIYYHL